MLPSKVLNKTNWSPSASTAAHQVNGLSTSDNQASLISLAMLHKMLCPPDGASSSRLTERSSNAETKKETTISRLPHALTSMVPPLFPNTDKKSSGKELRDQMEISTLLLPPHATADLLCYYFFNYFIHPYIHISIYPYIHISIHPSIHPNSMLVYYGYII